MLKFMSFGSGSCGNCYYICTETYGMLIDAGIGIRKMKKYFCDYGLSFDDVKCIIVTHDHADHVKAVGMLSEAYNLPVFATGKVHEGIRRNYCVHKKVNMANVRVLNKGEKFCLGEFEVRTFDVPHDSLENVGYLIKCGDRTFALMTDVGHVTDEMAEVIGMADYLVIEANYDEEMLRFGSYPTFLKERVASPTGHLSNREAAEFLATHYDGTLKNIWLCHLSRDNNHPELAYKTVDIRLFQEGIRVGKDVSLVALKRTTPSEMYELD